MNFFHQWWHNVNKSCPNHDTTTAMFHRCKGSVLGSVFILFLSTALLIQTKKLSLVLPNIFSAALWFVFVIFSEPQMSSSVVFGEQWLSSCHPVIYTIVVQRAPDDGLMNIFISQQVCLKVDLWPCVGVGGTIKPQYLQRFCSYHEWCMWLLTILHQNGCCKNTTLKHSV